jgi:amino-acid N-acetyltransferase
VRTELQTCARSCFQAHGGGVKEPLLIRAHPPKAMAVTLLEAAKLPTQDLRDEMLPHFFYAGSDDAPQGLVGLELLGGEALLRSLVVEEQARGLGLGKSLVEHAEKQAAARGVRSLYLLTTTAESFFKRLNYARVDRNAAPATIRRTSEYASLCPASSVFMVKQLKGDL